MSNTVVDVEYKPRADILADDEPKEAPFLRTPFNYDMNAASEASAAPFDPDSPGRTIQSAKDDADINVIVKRFGLTGNLPQSIRLPQYGDYTGISDFQTAMNVVRQARESFMELPADIRSRFGNDPQAFLEFCSNPENAEDLVKMGLAERIPQDMMASPSTNGDGNVNVSGGANSGDASSGKSGEVAPGK